MSGMITQLLIEDPSVVLIGDNSTLRSQIIKKLQEKNLKVIILDYSMLLSEQFDKNVFNQAYKVVLLSETLLVKEKYLKILAILKEFESSLIVIMKVFQSIVKAESNLLFDWVKASEYQKQLIIDYNYYFPQALFIFGQGVVVPDVMNSSLRFTLSNLSQGIIIKPFISLSYLETRVFVDKLFSYLFLPYHQTSILFKGQENKERVESLIKKLYDSYQDTNLEIINSKIEISSTIPFRVREKYLEYSPRDIAIKLVRQLDKPVFKKDGLFLQKPKQDEVENKVVLESLMEESVKTIEIKPKHVITSQNNVDDEIERIFADIRIKEKTKRIKKNVVKSKKQTKKQKRRSKFFKVGMVVSGLALSFLVLFIVFVSSTSLLKKQINKTIEKDLTSLVSSNSCLSNFVLNQSSLYSYLFSSNLIDQAILLSKLKTSFIQASETLITITETAQKQFLSIFSNNDEDLKTLFQKQALNVKKLYKQISDIQASFKKIDLGEDSQIEVERIKKFNDSLTELKRQQEVYLQLSSSLPVLLGLEGKKTYAVLLQNNQELRPTGGFIQAIALLTFDNGKLVSSSVQSVYELDKKISGEVQPPADLTKYLGEKQWYLRDGNWNADFPSTGKQIAWFISKATGRDIDGVIAFNLYTLKDILKVLGPIEVPEFNEVISDKNIFERMEFHSEVILVDSANSLDYSTTIFKHILEKIRKIKKANITPLVTAVQKNFEERQLLVTVFNNDVESNLDSLGWSGKLIMPSCPTKLSTKECKIDYVGQVEANVGVNKANYYLTRQITQKIELNRQEAKHSRIIKYHNNARSNSWPKGTYHSYQRFYLPNNANIDSILIDGVLLTKEQFSFTDKLGFKEIGFLVTVPIQKEVAVEVNYSTPLAFNNDFSYVFFNQKQSGLIDQSIKVEIIYDASLTPILIAPTARVEANHIVFDNNKDISLFGVQFQ